MQKNAQDTAHVQVPEDKKSKNRSFTNVALGLPISRSTNDRP